MKISKAPNLFLVSVIVCIGYLISSCMILQVNGENDDSRKKIINYQDSIIELNFLVNSKKIKTVRDAQYYWCNSDVINSNKGGYSGYLLNGDYQVFDKKKRLITDGQYNYGLKTGEWKKWYSNGNIKVIENWEDGFKDGAEFIYNIQGRLVSQNNYKKGLLDGLSCSYSNDSTRVYRYKNGKQILKQEKKETPKLKLKKHKKISNAKSQIDSAKVGS